MSSLRQDYLFRLSDSRPGWFVHDKDIKNLERVEFTSVQDVLKQTEIGLDDLLLGMPVGRFGEIAPGLVLDKLAREYTGFQSGEGKGDSGEMFNFAFLKGVTDSQIIQQGMGFYRFEEQELLIADFGLIYGKPLEMHEMPHADSEGRIIYHFEKAGMRFLVDYDDETVAFEGRD